MGQSQVRSMEATGLFCPMCEVREGRLQDGIYSFLEVCLCVQDFLMDGDALGLETDHFRRIVSLEGKSVAPAVRQLRLEHVGEDAVGVIPYDADVRQFLHYHCEYVGGAEGGVVGEQDDGLCELRFSEGLEILSLDRTEVIGSGPLFRSSVVTDSRLVREAASNEVDHGVGAPGIIANVDNEAIQSGEPRKDPVKGGVCLLLRKALEFQYAQVAKIVRLGMAEQLGVILDLVETILSEILVGQLKEFLDELLRGKFAVELWFVFRVELPFVLPACLQVDVSILQGG